jgi:glutathione S-transferase
VRAQGSAHAAAGACNLLTTMIKVHKFGPAFGMPDASPFVVKVETYLRITGQKYETVTADVRKAPRKQLPYVDVDGTIIPDSTRILDEFEGRRADKLDAHLSDHERSVAFAFKSMLEAHLYFGMLFMRWATDDGWAVFEPTLREMLGAYGVPSLMRGMVAKAARKQTVTRVVRQGIGRAPRREVVATCNEIVDAVSHQLGASTFICGDRPTTYDATLYAFASGLLCPAFDNEVRKHTANKENIVAYDKRLREKYWGE